MTQLIEARTDDVWTPARVGLEPDEKLQLALEKGLGAPVKEAVPPLGNFDQYCRLRTGRRFADIVAHLGDAREAEVAANLVNALRSAENKVLLQAYAAAQLFEDRISRVGAPIRDLRPAELVRLSYFPNLSMVDPESSDYTQFPPLTDERVSGTLVQYGNVFDHSRKVLINDDLNVIGQYAQRAGEAARQTKAEAVWSLFMSNAVFRPDSTAWFAAGHANLQSVALSADAAGDGEVMAAITKLFSQTQPGSGKKFGLPASLQDAGLTLVVPIGLLGIAQKLNNGQGYGCYHAFGDRGEQIISPACLLDTTDWAVFQSPDSVPSIQVRFLFGQEQPTIALADNQTVPAMLLADRLSFKVSHAYVVMLADFRGAVKAVVAG